MKKSVKNKVDCFHTSMSGGPYTDSHGNICYVKNGRFHREDGPARVCVKKGWSSSTKEWWVDGLLHREDGPAIEYYSGAKRFKNNAISHGVCGPVIEKKRWFVGGMECTEENHEEALKIWKLNEVMK